MKANRIVATMLAAALVLTAAACQGDSPEPPPVTSTPVSSPTPTPTPTAAALPDFTKWQTEPADIPVPPMPAAAKNHSKAGSVAFVRYYLDLLNLSMLTSNGSAAKELSIRDCERCKLLESGFTTIISGGKSYLGDPRYTYADLASSDYSPSSAGVGGTMLRKSWRSREKGSSSSSKRPAERVGVVLRTEWTDGGWQVVYFSANPL